MLTEKQLVEGLQPIRKFVLAAALQHLFRTGLYDEIRASDEPLDINTLAATLNLDIDRLRALLLFLTHEGVLLFQDDRVSMREAAAVYAACRSWYETLIGGYGESYLQIGDALELNSPPVSRNGTLVGIGSCGMSIHDAIPILQRLLKFAGKNYRVMLDLGCGAGLYLTEMCRDYPDLHAIGVEPDGGGYRAAVDFVKAQGFSNRVTLHHTDALNFLSQTNAKPDLTLICFVAHEVLGQEGENGVRELIDSTFTVNPQGDLIVIEVDLQWEDTGIMQTPVALAYYNPYYLLNPFTQQLLKPATYWEDLFVSCGLYIVKKFTIDPSLDPNGLTLGWLLRQSN
jgi:2-ketoarginine methyltransferase